MTTLSFPLTFALTKSDSGHRPSEKSDWPLIGDTQSFRADIPEALIRWRAARGEAPPVLTLKK